MPAKIQSLIDHVAFILKKYRLQENGQQNNIYRIVEIKKSHHGQSKLIIQVIGKSSVFECTPQEIVAVDCLLEGFSKKDVRAITYLACEQIKQPKYKIVMQEFCEKFNKMIFKLKASENESPVIKTANQIVMDKNLINNLSKEDVNSISYIAGYECSQHEK